METGLQLVRTRAALSALAKGWHDLGRTIALVPTMGALHEGHLALVHLARERAAHVVVSIFVNPTQFGPGEDLQSYPRDLQGDVDKLRAAGVDAVYAPPVEEIYPAGFATTVHVEGPATAGLEDAFRPGHFDGVATVVAKLFAQSACDIAVFGQKDYQQLQVIRRMSADLDLPVHVIGAPTIRETDGLAMSSRNAYLSPQERKTAPALHRALQAAASAIRAGRSPQRACAEAMKGLKMTGFATDYLQARQAASLAPLTADYQGPIRLLAAARLGRTRLIDNIAV